MTRRSDTLNQPALRDSESLPLLGSDSVQAFGPTLVIAPHPDDESLGCGGAISLQRQHDIPVRVLVVSDGCGSHPNSRKYPAQALRELREAEALAALAILGVNASAVSFLGLPDRAVPDRGAPGFAHAVEACRAALMTAPAPDTVLMPWRRDPHCDHRASWEIATAAIATAGLHVRVIEYPIWVWDLAEPGDMPEPSETRTWRLDIAPVLRVKLAAIAAHRSQTTNLIDDDPGGFRLQPETLAHFSHPWEVYLEPCQ